VGTRLFLGPGLHGKNRIFRTDGCAAPRDCGRVRVPTRPPSTLQQVHALSGRLTDFHQGLVDPDQDFRQGQDRDEKNLIKV